MVDEEQSAWQHAIAVTRPALLLASPRFLEETTKSLRKAGIQDAVAGRDSAPIFDWLAASISLQGISDAIAFNYDAEHGGITFMEIAGRLGDQPSCPRLGCYWSFAGCGYRKGAARCAEPEHQRACPLPKHLLRKGSLNVAAYGLYLFIRDVCDSDIVGWIDDRLQAADPGLNEPDRVPRMIASLIEPLVNIAGTGPKIWSMMLADFLLVGDPNRERWVATGAGMLAVDTLVHGFLHRTGTLSRLAAEHPYGEACYLPGGCAGVIEELARRIDAREFNAVFPATFPRFVQYALWRFCAAGGRDICNGNRVNNRQKCAQLFCPAASMCDRVPLRA